MNFSIDAPYDERLLRRTLRHLIRRSVLVYRALGLLLVLLGALLASSAGTRGSACSTSSAGSSSSPGAARS